MWPFCGCACRCGQLLKLCSSGVEAWAVQGFDPWVAPGSMPSMGERHHSLYGNKSIQEVDRDAKAG